MNVCYILKNERGDVSFRLKIILLVISIIIPFVILNTIFLQGLYRQVIASIHNEEQLVMVGSSFFSIFIINALMSLGVASVAVRIVFWVVKPWDKLSQKIIRTMGSNSPPPEKIDDVQYAMDLLDKKA